MADHTTIKMTDNTWDSAKIFLGRGQVLSVVATASAPGEISSADASLLLERGLAEPHGSGRPAIKDMLKAEIQEELAGRQVAFAPDAKRGQLADLLAAARKEQAV